MLLSYRDRLKTLVRALRHRNFRLFYAGQGISLIGTWMQRVAVGWLVYRLTGSVFLLGMVGFASQIPTLILSPVAGVMADRFDRHRLLLITQVLSMVQALTLALLVLTNIVEVWHIMVLTTFLGVINAFDMPIRQSFMVKMIDDKNDLGNAIALNSSMVNGARLFGPSAAGLIIAAVGEGICFLLNGASYIAVIASLLMMRGVRQSAKPTVSNAWQKLTEGISYASRFRPIRDILLMLALISIAGMPYTVLMPVFAKDILHGGPETLGFLMGAVGVGAFVGIVYLASRRSVVGLGNVVPVAAATLGVGLIVFSFSRQLWLSLGVMLIVGCGQMVLIAASNTLLQTIVDDDKRGRVMSLYTMSFMGMMPIGSLISGSIASRIGVGWTVAVGGAACLAGAWLFSRQLPMLKRAAYPVYVRLGLIPEISAAVSGESGDRPPQQRAD